MVVALPVKFSSNYSPYGQNYAISGKETFMFTGKPYDSATGLYYEGARYYDASIGRFVTQDSESGTIQDPMSLNWYIYARDNPMVLGDINGHEFGWFSSVGNAIGSGISAAGNAIVSGASAPGSDVSNTVVSTWNSLPPQDQAIVTTAAVDVGAMAEPEGCRLMQARREGGENRVLIRN